MKLRYIKQFIKRSVDINSTGIDTQILVIELMNDIYNSKMFECIIESLKYAKYTAQEERKRSSPSWATDGHDAGHENKSSRCRD